MKRAFVIGGCAVGFLILLLGAQRIWQLASGGWNPEPPKAARAWGEGDIVGTWQYPSGPKGMVTITFNIDGTFEQVVTETGAAPIRQVGHWAVRETPYTKSGNHGVVEGCVNVYGVLMNMGGKWVPHEWDWWDVVESQKRPGELAIWGGTFPDPDVYVEITRVMSATTSR